MAIGKLKVKEIEALPAGQHGDGGTLYLRVQESGSRQWVQIIQTGGRRVERGLGGYPLVSLQEARELAFENRRALRRGENPFAKRHPLAAAISNGAVPASNAPTFAEALEAVLELQRPHWRNGKTEKQWRASLEAYAMPTIGKMPVDAVTSADVMAVLEPIWNAKRETAQRVKQRIQAVMAWAVGKGHRKDNPVAGVDAILPKARAPRKHHRALPYAEVPAAIAAVRKGDAKPGTIRAFAFLVLTAARSGEVRFANWSEIDWDAKTWTVPAERMKAKKAHVVPLSKTALGILEFAAREHGEDGLIFPSRQGKPLSDGGFADMLKAAGVDAVPHGFRSSFADWAAESGVAREVKEAALAHTLKNAVEGSYTRTTYVEERREVMRAWAKHCMAVKVAKGGWKQVELV